MMDTIDLEVTVMQILRFYSLNSFDITKFQRQVHSHWLSHLHPFSMEFSIKCKWNVTLKVMEDTEVLPEVTRSPIIPIF